LRELAEKAMISEHSSEYGQKIIVAVFACNTKGTEFEVTKIAFFAF
jgi:hypothetical protein